MSVLHFLIDLFLHLDKHLSEAVQQYGVWTYALLFLIVFCETGLIVTPVLPGDSLLFAAGALAALGALNFWGLFFLISVASILGDTVNYWVGRTTGQKLFTRGSRFLKPEHIDKTQAFYTEYGGKTIILARFIPIVRTFSPFVAGLGKMPYTRFLAFSIPGSFLWVGLCIAAGYSFGNIPFVKANFSVVILGIIGVSLLPALIGFLNGRKKKSSVKV